MDGSRGREETANGQNHEMAKIKFEKLKIIFSVSAAAAGRKKS